jgi:methylglyoxal synthase
MTHHYTSRTGDIGGDDQIGTRICRLLADITCLHRDCIDVGSTYYVVPSLVRSGTTAWPVWPSRASYEEHWYYKRCWG